MPTLSNGKKSIEVEANSSIIDAAENLGVPFSCTEGNCGTCLTTIVSGMENLSEKSEAEENFGLEDNERLLCQVQIKSGEVVIED